VFHFLFLFRGKTFGNSHVGMAHVNSMCGDQSGAIVQDDKGSFEWYSLLRVDVIWCIKHV
jgi:hypothetical protein